MSVIYAGCNAVAVVVFVGQLSLSETALSVAVELIVHFRKI